ncbi:hypothetical protein [Saccharopolyspora sp. MS10]|uniref:hypothetical protein n=1 Tax=Saccharopolyspora sp. MS10 TaxID=3385973 RepID=UPI0039A2CC13
MTSRKRITIALVGLLALVVIGWFVQQGSAEPGPGPGSAQPGIRAAPAVWQAVPGLPQSSGPAGTWRVPAEGGIGSR